MGTQFLEIEYVPGGGGGGSRGQAIEGYTRLHLICIADETHTVSTVSTPSGLYAILLLVSLVTSVRCERNKFNKEDQIQ